MLIGSSLLHQESTDTCKILGEVSTQLSLTLDNVLFTIFYFHQELFLQ